MTSSKTAVAWQILPSWLTDPDTEPPENRDPALLKLTFIDLVDDSDIRAFAAARAAQHRAWLDDYRQRRAALDPDDPAAAARRRVLDLGVRYEQTYTDFWESVVSE
ncbi:hypothetical protein [Nocardia stercoris]|uniref:Transcription regulator PadR C-terminal domain-containing protein n=1 Tax=Nocardia stercoris TaxID=2483361 RepID=A0A3M2KYB4_9NOCA|nr:hypothetical protein [Nocardia stercoris]RMI29253.1 hypothetical protein EBN03_26265 [Nocardia stercoris]